MLGCSKRKALHKASSLKTNTRITNTPKNTSIQTNVRIAKTDKKQAQKDTIKPIQEATKLKFNTKFYPKAKVVKMFTNSIQGLCGLEIHQKTAILETNDSIDKVKAFYCSFFRDPVVTKTEDNRIVITPPERRLANETGITAVVLKDKRGKTEIAIIEGTK